ncbi:hypothetical protein CCACVL1_30376 [Corchorus capsularis]|uniref:Uncharacterized protein n=1 Tax=Corchorus capsularis TaxID=210143 RepID=A0A1R3FXJ4_COCAP|nr:hypothetical protein CCACVL1_30376 [Corchorus capsularis]
MATTPAVGSMATTPAVGSMAMASTVRRGQKGPKPYGDE